MSDIADDIEMLTDYCRDGDDKVPEQIQEAAQRVEIWLATHDPNKDL